MSWTYLFAAVILDVGATVALKASGGLSRPVLLAISVVLFGVSIFAVGLALRDLPLLSVYAIWLGLGIGLAAVAGGLWFQESLTTGGWLSVGAIVVGVFGLAMSATDDSRRSLDAVDRAAVSSSPIQP